MNLISIKSACIYLAQNRQKLNAGENRILLALSISLSLKTGKEKHPPQQVLFYFT